MYAGVPTAVPARVRRLVPATRRAETEVEHQHVVEPPAAQEDVGRLDVAVDHAPRMRERERRSDPPRHRDGRVDIQGAGPQALGRSSPSSHSMAR